MRRVFRLPAILLVGAASCEGGLAPTGPTEPDPPVHEAVRTIGGAHAATMIRPLDCVAGTPLPIVMALHRFTSNAADNPSLTRGGRSASPGRRPSTSDGLNVVVYPRPAWLLRAAVRKPMRRGTTSA